MKLELTQEQFDLVVDCVVNQRRELKHQLQFVIGEPPENRFRDRIMDISLLLGSLEKQATGQTTTQK